MADNLSLVTFANNRKSFTLIELLVVLALVAILSVVVVMTLNPAELLKQARDSNRLSDLATLNTALNLFSADVIGGFMGTSTIIYVSIPDTTSTCANLGLPAIPTSTGWSYNCVTSQNLRNTDGTGWIPVNFQRISSNSPISQLPIDSQNTTSTKYYTYVAGGSWKVMATPESQKYITTAGTDGGSNIGQFEVGNNMNLAPFADGLVGWWKFDEGNGTSTLDSSGLGFNGVASGTAIVAGRVGAYARSFDGVSSYVYINDSNIWDFGTGSFSVAAWVKYTSTALGTIMARDNAQTSGGWMLRTENATGKPAFYVVNNPNRSYQSITSNNAYNDNSWHMVVGVRDAINRQIRLYVDGSSAANSIADIGYSVNPPAGVYPAIGRNSTYAVQYYFPGSIDDVRVYNRALSSVEVSSLYNLAR